MSKPLSHWVVAVLLAAAAMASAQQPRGPVSNPVVPWDPEKPFADVPPIQPVPRLGWFAPPPTGPGYYTLFNQLHDVYLEAPPKYPIPRYGLVAQSFFDIDWRYLDNPNNTEHDFFDCLKRQKFGDCLMFTTGGEFRYRANSETNARLNDNGVKNDYDLTRLRIYGDLWITDSFRIYLEYIDAQGFNNDLAWLPVDRNWGDLLNAFIDVRTLTLADYPVWLRVGRQELLYGSQRLISPLEWSNTRRTFQGVKLFWQTKELSVDAFLTNPVIPNNREFDWVDQDTVFSGLWLTYRPDPNQAIDAYVLNVDRANNAQTGRDGFKGGSNVTTFGSRYDGMRNGWLWDVEGMFQVGTYSNQSLTAYAATANGGYQFTDLPSRPTFWVGYDYASGDPSPGTGDTRHTFDQLFPFGHYYFGALDLVGRRNIHDISLSSTVYPVDWVSLTAQYHNFHLARSRDALYNAAGLPTREDPTGRDGTFIGQEVDLFLNFHLSNHQDIFISYSYLYAGEFLRRTAKTDAGRGNPDALYLQYTYRW